MGIGESTFFVTEEFAFKQRFTDRRAVDRNEHFVTTTTEVVDHLGDDFFTRSVFTRDQNRQLGIGNALDRCFKFGNAIRFADQVHFIGGLRGNSSANGLEMFDVLRCVDRDRCVRRKFFQGRFIAVGKVAFVTVN